ncbi:hypothetical protein DPMN_006948 [Dreissena polymorpha]|uniref:Uncharacterized protein n=1 Tax=Dreissena polymorpha TaxID=45954 RepID=A0A9D4MVK7_DREPO|nr:hypothetical protein DPMN_006948 [Dreissena polymorpha]
MAKAAAEDPSKPALILNTDMITIPAFNAKKAQMQRFGYTVKTILNYIKHFTLFLRFLLMDAHVDLQARQPHEHQRIKCVLDNVANARKGLDNAMCRLFRSEKAVKEMPPTPYMCSEVIRAAQTNFDQHMIAIRTPGVVGSYGEMIVHLLIKATNLADL